LADELLFGKLANGGTVHVDIDDNNEVKLIFVQDQQSAETSLATA
jgi:ATP-dependent Clp protease ATP-binding subunit ClpA